MQFATEDNEFVVERPKALDIYCVVYVGDILTVRQKRSPLYRLGGKLFPFPDFYTVPNNVTPRCTITRLRKAMRSVHKNLIDPKTYENWIQSYTLKNQWNPESRAFEDITVGVSGASAALLFKPINPVSEIGRVADTRTGVIALEAECGIKSGQDITEAQLFYFPNWIDILQGKATLPETLIELQDHINNRRDAALSSELRAIGDAYLLSCSEFYDWGKAYVDYQTMAIKETEAKPGGVRYDEVAERLFKMLNLTREDKLVQSFASNQAAAESANTAMATAIAKLAETQGQSTQWMQNALQVMMQIATGKEITAPLADQPPVPATDEEALAEIARANETEGDDGFTDMSAAVIPTEEDEDPDAIFTEYLEKAVKDEPETPVEG